jgi:hypothetical protein
VTNLETPYQFCTVTGARLQTARQPAAAREQGAVDHAAWLFRAFAGCWNRPAILPADPQVAIKGDECCRERIERITEEVVKGAWQNAVLPGRTARDSRGDHCRPNQRTPRRVGKPTWGEHDAVGRSVPCLHQR